MTFFQGMSSVVVLAVDGPVVPELPRLVDVGSLQLRHEQMPMDCSRDAHLCVDNNLSMSLVL